MKILSDGFFVEHGVNKFHQLVMFLAKLLFNILSCLPGKAEGGVVGGVRIFIKDDVACSTFDKIFEVLWVHMSSIIKVKDFVNVIRSIFHTVPVQY